MDPHLKKGKQKPHLIAFRESLSTVSLLEKGCLNYFNTFLIANTSFLLESFTTISTRDARTTPSISVGPGLPLSSQLCHHKLDDAWRRQPNRGFCFPHSKYKPCKTPICT